LVPCPFLDAKPIYKPFHYPWAYDAWLMQQRIHWLPEEVPLADDVKDWRNKLTDSERHLLTQIFRFFTQADVEVNNCYMRHYSRVFKPTEVQMMLAAFSRWRRCMSPPTATCSTRSACRRPSTRPSSPSRR
jgi:ribonucleoside-diphosphate reductase beta chain